VPTFQSLIAIFFSPNALGFSNLNQTIINLINFHAKRFMTKNSFAATEEGPIYCCFIGFFWEGARTISAAYVD
jgi:hypothetical protein